MKKIYSLLILTLLCITASAQLFETRITRNNVCEFVMSEIVKGDYDYYLGTRTVPLAQDSLNGKWFLVFVDEEPNSGWEHPCKYVYVRSGSTIQNPEYVIVDSLCPPPVMDILPKRKSNRYGDKAKMKPFVPKMPANDPNPAAGHTYAVILNGGMSVTANRETYWNDCSFIYKTLRNRYEVPKQNIKVIMSDGTASGLDLNTETGGYISSPLDLDDDSIPDIEYMATKYNLRRVLNGLAETLTEEDHLLLFITDHGGFDRVTKEPYLYLWNNEKLYSNELASFLEPINAGFISIVMGQCYSGGFIEALQRPNRIIATACKGTERSFNNPTIPFNEFLYHWTSALNGYDATGKKVNGGKTVSMLDAQSYAARNDLYANGKAAYASETPMINYFRYSVVEDLSLENVPPTVDLCFDSYKGNIVSTLVTKEYEIKNDVPWGSISHRYADYGIFKPFNFWNSPYIWVRNNADGKEHQVSEKLRIEEEGDRVYMYVKVRNRGVRPYMGGTMDVKSYWANSELYLTENQWKGYSTSDKNEGGAFSTAEITDNILPGKSTIVEMKKFFADKDFTSVKGKTELCLLAFLKESEKEDGFPVDSNHIATVWATNKLCQSNVVERIKCIDDSFHVAISNQDKYDNTFSVFVLRNEWTQQLLSESNLSLKLSPDLVSSWIKGGYLCEAVEQDKNSAGTFCLKSDTSKLTNLKMKPFQKGRIGLACNFFADNAITERKEYDIDVALIDDATGQCLGGETFRIVQEPRPAINPVISSSVLNGRTVLAAGNVSEDVLYKWYDADGTLVGTGETFAVPAGKPLTSYKVKAEAVNDGAISYSEPVQAKSSSIKSVDTKSNPDVVRIIFNRPVAANASLRLFSATSNVLITTYRVISGSAYHDIPAVGMPSGVYQVILMENGEATGSEKFAK